MSKRKQKNAVAALPTDAKPIALAYDTEMLDDRAIKWLAGGHRGLSSNAMFSAITGVDTGKGALPSDAWDFARCVRLLVECPHFRDHMDRVAAISGNWANLVEHWDILEVVLRSEWATLFDASVTKRDSRIEHSEHPALTYHVLKLVLGRVKGPVETYDLAA
jgi:hypothetical protein